MDSSDTIAKNKQKAVYIDQLNSFLAANPSGDCSKLSTCCGAPSSCVTYFPSYEAKYTFYNGRDACAGCTSN
jgi:hypothetical protein